VMGVVYDGTHQDVATMPGIPQTIGSDVELLPRVHTRPHHH